MSKGSRAHITRFNEDTKPSEWKQPRPTRCLCGYDMLDAKPLSEAIEDISEFAPKSTITTCSGCWILAKAPNEEQGRSWLYVILPAEQADRMNASKAEEE